STRAVAQRAELPLGAVSYHFHGKQELLIQAALQTVEEFFPLRELETVDTLAELFGSMLSALGGNDSFKSGLAAVLQETMREAGRDSRLADRMTVLLDEYRRRLRELIRAEQQRGVVPADLDPAAVATLLAAAGDGMLLHILRDSELDAVGTVDTLHTLLRTRT